MKGPSSHGLLDLINGALTGAILGRRRRQESVIWTLDCCGASLQSRRGWLMNWRSYLARPISGRSIGRSLGGEVDLLKPI